VALAEEWIGQRESKQKSGLAFYIDGHVRVYHGDATKLPRSESIFSTSSK
jgi:hypothetical protein